MYQPISHERLPTRALGLCISLFVVSFADGAPPVVAATSTTTFTPPDAGPTAAPTPGSDSQASSYEPFRVEQFLPPSVAENTDINAWGWFSYLHDSGDDDDDSYWNGDVSLGITQRIGDRVAATVDIHYVNDNNDARGFLEQAFFTAEISQRLETLFTIGKFNASFGIEPRNEWDRLGGTTSLLFGAQPQDLVGAMITQPIGSTGVTVRPFIATQFQGHAEFNAPPSGGVLVEYTPWHALKFTMTNWIGPGITPPNDDDDDDDYSYDSNEYALSNWTGPALSGSRNGVLYLIDATVRWNPRPDLTLGAEGLFAATGPSANQSGWCGVLALANYDITDRLRVFGRWSYLNDNEGIVTGVDQQHHELSVGAGFQIIEGLELRGEYRHDFAPSGDLDSVSAHLTFAF